MAPRKKSSSFQASKYFVVIVALVIGGTRYMNSQMKRKSFAGQTSFWDSDKKDGQRYTITTRSKDTNGAYFEVHGVCLPSAPGFYPQKPCALPLHAHSGQEETVTLLEGSITVSFNGTERALQAGEKVTIPAGVPHYWYNSGSGPLLTSSRFSPGEPSESFFENLAGLSLESGGLSKVNPIQLVVLFAEHGVELSELPPQLWQAAKTVVLPLGKLMGYVARYPQSYETATAGQPEPYSPRAARDDDAKQGAAEAEVARGEEGVAGAVEAGAAVSEEEAVVEAEVVEAVGEEVEEVQVGSGGEAGVCGGEGQQGTCSGGESAEEAQA